MDFEFAIWQMIYLMIKPQQVYRNFAYRKVSLPNQHATYKRIPVAEPYEFTTVFFFERKPKLSLPGMTLHF
jgi:hypothetical protein